MRTRILLTDDNTEFSLNLKDILEIKGYEVFIANDAAAAIEFIRHTGIDLVLMDIRMPGMNGVEAFTIMKLMIPDVPFIMLTGFAVDELIRESLRNGVWGCLRKPLDFDELFIIIENAMADGIRMLMVDEDPDFCREIKAVCGRTGLHVSFARDGNEAIAKVQKNFYDILVMDKKVPPLQGIETFLSLNDLRPEMNVVITVDNIEKEKSPVVASMEKKGCIFVEKESIQEALLSLLDRIDEEKKERKIPSH
jgi:two-component system, NtrC family, response regulator HydG